MVLGCLEVNHFFLFSDKIASNSNNLFLNQIRITFTICLDNKFVKVIFYKNIAQTFLKIHP